MADARSRTLRLLSLLQARRHWSGDALADQLGVSPRTVRRDIERLRDRGYPVEAQPGVNGGYQLAPGASLPPLVLDDDEAAAIAVGLLGAVHSPVSGTADASARALGKLVQVMPGRVRRQVDALARMTDPAAWGPPRDTVDATTLGTIAQAARDNERLELSYRGADGPSAERRIEPHRLVALGQRWYLVAYDHSRSDWRTFRVDRIDGIRPTGARFAPRPIPTGDAARFVRERITHLARPVQVVADLAAPADDIRARIGRWCQVNERGTAACTVRIGTESLEWAALALLSAGVPFDVREPPALVELLRRWGDRIGELGSGDPDPRLGRPESPAVMQ